MSLPEKDLLPLFPFRGTPAFFVIRVWGIADEPFDIARFDQ